MSEPRLSLVELKLQVAAAAGAPVAAILHAQVLARTARMTREQKPYFDFELGDGGAHLRFKIWSNHPFYGACASLEPGDFIEAEGEFAGHGTYGPEIRSLRCRALTGDEREGLLLGSPERRARLDHDYADIVRLVESVADPRLRAVAGLFLERFEGRFRRAAAARSFHHARRGGLVEHVAQMMRAAEVLCGIYPQLNRDLVIAGVLFHDCGKLWECCPPEQAFAIERTETGELLGHINIGFELVNRLWSDLRENGTLTPWQALTPKSDLVRQHLLHLVASHHGEMQFGSPVVPKTPEAMLLHYIDNLDARLEMLTGAYASAPELAPGIFDRVAPLPSPVVQPLPKWRTEGEA